MNNCFILNKIDMNQIRWKTYAGEVLNGIVLLTLASLAGSLCNFAGSVGDGFELASGFMDGNFDMDNFMPDEWDVAQWVMLVLEIIGYVMYLSGLKKFSTEQQPGDAGSVMKVRSGAIWMLVGVIVGNIPVIGKFFKLIFVIIGFMDMLGGYKALKRSQTFPAATGAGTLHSALVLQLIGVLIGILPFMGFIEVICDIIVFFMIISGWSAIKNANLKQDESRNVSPHDETAGGSNTPKSYAVMVATSSMYELRVYAYDKKGSYAPELSALALEEIREREAGRRTRLTEQEAWQQEKGPVKEEYVLVLSQKSDEELKELIRDEKMYEPAFVFAVREELQARVLGKRRQKTAEEIQWEQLRKEEEKRLQEEKQKEEEERIRKEEEEKEEQLRKERREKQYKANTNAARILFIVICVLALGLIGYALLK